jgi:hypothetical protein
MAVYEINPLKTRESLLKGKVSTLALLALTYSDKLLLILKLYFSFSQNSLSY